MIKPMQGLAVSLHTGGLVMLQLSTGRMFASNVVGARIWSALARGTTLAEIAAGLAEEFGVPKDRAHRDLNKFIAELREQRVVDGESGR